MDLQHNSLSQEMGTYYKIMMENTYCDDINKVFIPFRPMIEMELLLTSLMAKENYHTLSKLPFTTLDLSYITRELKISQQSAFYTIIERFFQNIQQIIPITSYSRKHEKHTRFGNVNAYTKSRIPVFYAIDRLKAKLLVLRNFLNHLQSHHYLLSSFPSYPKKSDKGFYSIFFAEYSTRLNEYFETVTWEPEYKSKFLKKPNQINYQFLHELNKFQIPTTHMDVIYIMRSIRASYLVCKIVFSMMDVSDPFVGEKGSIEPLILNRDIIPGMLDVIATAYRINDSKKIREIVNLFEQYLTWMISGTNLAYKLASNNQIRLEENRTLYYSGEICKF